VRYALFWRGRGSLRYNLTEFEAGSFGEAVSMARLHLSKTGGLVGYLVAEILAAEVRPDQKFVSLMDEVW